RGANALLPPPTRGLAKELAPMKVRVNGVAPGVILTPLHDRHSSQAMLDALQASIPMGRLGTADECSGAFLYLASDAASGYVTGQVIEVNGGQLMPLLPRGKASRARYRVGLKPDPQRNPAPHSPCGQAVSLAR